VTPYFSPLKTRFFFSFHGRKGIFQSIPSFLREIQVIVLITRLLTFLEIGLVSTYYYDLDFLAEPEAPPVPPP